MVEKMSERVEKFIFERELKRMGACCYHVFTKSRCTFSVAGTYRIYHSYNGTLNKTLVSAKPFSLLYISRPCNNLL